MPVSQKAIDFHSRLHLGIDTDWLKNDSDRELYVEARKLGISLPLKFKQRGFDHARLRVKEYDLLLIEPKTGLSLIAEIEQCVSDCNAASLTPIVAFQCEGFKLDPSVAERERVVAWWKMVAARLEGVDVAFNILIESTDLVRKNSAALNDLYKECAKEIALIDPERVMVCCPMGISNPFDLGTLVVPENHFFVEAHFYAAGLARVKGNWTTGTASEKKAITDKLNAMQKFTTDTGIPAWVGAIMFGNYNETGDLFYDYTIDDQKAIAQFVLGEAKTRNIPVALNSDSKFWDEITHDWRTEMVPLLEAIAL
jgi:Cellulase (glycosyl hydrolase family 5)